MQVVLANADLQAVGGARILRHDRHSVGTEASMTLHSDAWAAKSDIPGGEYALSSGD